MTTIAFRDGILASDSLASYGETKVPGDMQKLFRLRDGSAAGVTGSEGEWRRVIAWLDGDRGAPQPQPIGENRSSVIVLHIDGTIEIFEDGYHFTESSKFMAWGSGQPAALGALHAGMSAADAVRIATMVDKSSGGAVQTMRPEPKLAVVA
ncbi:MAG: proteasome and subunit [Verrucomicrobiales bacterium]|nr:proteasome and subunit [Verrucomicrobiales bacterium]